MANDTIQKIFCHWAVTFYIVLDSLVTTKVSIGIPVYKTSEYPAVSSLDIDNPICYIQQSNGLTLNLSDLCSQDETRNKLSLIDRQFLDSYNNLLGVYQNAQTFVTPDTAKKQSPIKTAQGICSALQNKVSLEQIKTDRYQEIVATEDKRNHQIALAESEIVDSLALKFYCPEFAQ